MPKWLDRWVIILGLATIGVAIAAAIWPEQHLFVGLVSALAWATIGHAYYKSRQ
jgi:hypothetical protein